MAYGRARDNWTKRHTPRLMLRAARKELNLSIRDLAKRANWSASYVGEVEKGTCEMSVEMAKSLAKVLMVNNWWELIERFTFVDDGVNCKFVGDNGTIIVVERAVNSDIEQRQDNESKSV